MDPSAAKFTKDMRAKYLVSVMTALACGENRISEVDEELQMAAFQKIFDVVANYDSYICTEADWVSFYQSVFKEVDHGYLDDTKLLEGKVVSNIQSLFAPLHELVQKDLEMTRANNDPTKQSTTDGDPDGTSSPTANVDLMSFLSQLHGCVGRGLYISIY